MEENIKLSGEARTFAAIDIGSNAVRLLIKQVVEPGQHPKLNKALLVRVPLRLGFDVFSDGRISEKKEKNLIRLMKSYRRSQRSADNQTCGEGERNKDRDHRRAGRSQDRI